MFQNPLDEVLKLRILMCETLDYSVQINVCGLEKKMFSIYEMFRNDDGG